MESVIWLIIFLLSFFVVNLIGFLWKRRYLYAISMKLPGPFAWPLVGNALIFFCKDKDIFSRAVQVVSNYPSPMRLWLGPKLFIIFRKASQVEKITNSSVFSGKDEKLYRFMREFDGNGLITESGPKWRKDRKILSPIFTSKIIGRYIPNMAYHSRILVENLGSEVDKPAFNVKKYIQRSVCDLINETIIGVKTDANSGSLDYYLQTINRMYIVVHARIAKFWLQIEWIFKLTNYYKEQEEGKKVIHGFMRDAYHEVDKLYKYDKESSSSILAEMLKIREVIPDFAGEWGFIYHLTTFYSASEDTIAVISSFCLVVFGLFPNIQKKAYEEINSHLAIGKVIEENDINKMEYLEMCIKDVLRLFPAAPFIIRTAAKDFQLDELLIPKGCSIILAIHNIHRDSDYWNTPDTFNPDHFKPEEVAKRPKHAYLPFSAGTRSCLGKIYAMQGLKVILATILREFFIEADGVFDDYKLKADISVRFYDDKYPIRLRRRKELFSNL